MAKTKSFSKGLGTKKKRRVRSGHELHQRPAGTTADETKTQTSEQMFFRASELFGQHEVDKALPIAQKSLDRFEEEFPNDPQATYPAFLLLGQIQLARGEVDLSRGHYLKATQVDPEGRKTGATPFLWIAQLSEEGGEDSIEWFERACAILRRELKEFESKYGIEEAGDEILEKRRQLGEALCSMTEVYMTDLSYAPLNAHNRSDANRCKLQL